jgi:hypothetical protein
MSPADTEARERANQRLREARQAWGEAMSAHKMAEPNPEFASRLRALASAAQAEREACEEAERAGLLWRPIPGAQTAQPPYELRPAPWRPALAPEELWERFDATVNDLNHAVTGTNPIVVGRAFGQLASAAEAVADAVQAESQEATKTQARRRAG